jgi:hypothetical protein
MIREYDNKETFIKVSSVEITNRLMLIDLYKNVVAPVIKKFDGKVINARLDNAINDVLKNYPKDIATLLIDGSRQKYTSYYDFNLLIQNSVMLPDGKWRYVTTNFCIILETKDGKRLDWNKTQEFADKMVTITQNKVDDLKNAIDNYDTYLSMYVELDEVVTKMVNDIPSCFRENMHADFIGLKH